MKDRKMLVTGIIIVGIVAVVAALAAAIFSKPLLTALATSTVKQRLINQSAKWDDGLYAGLAGSGGPFPDIKRAGLCIVVLAGDRLYIVDAGQGAPRNIALMGFQLGRVDAVLLTHFHSDHIADLGEIMMQRWVGGSNAKPLDIIGPEGVGTMVEGFNLAYKFDDAYRVAHHGEATLPPSGAGGTAQPFTLDAAEDAAVVVIDDGGLKVTAFKVSHAPVSPAVGYRFDYQGRSLVISGDTLPCESLEKQAQGADILFQSALQPSMVSVIHDQAGSSTIPSLAKITEDIPGYHSSPEDAARTAAAAGVKQLVLYHITPPIPNPLLNNMYLGDAGKYYSGPITIGDDGMLFSLPANSGKISVSNPLK